MNLSDYFTGPDCGLSFELFPPKTDAGVNSLMDVVEELMRYSPDFFTCTYGAGGSTQTRTLEIAGRVHEQHSIPVATHLTCVGSTVDQLKDYLQQAKSRGIEHVVALRGDPPKGESQFQAVQGGLRYANELVELIRESNPEMGIAVAGYPEVHQEAPDAQTDLENLKRKVDTGADIVVTQLFYQNEDYFRFVDSCRSAGITIPIVPGILPVTNLAQIERITAMCKAKLPQKFHDALAANDDPNAQFQVGVEFAVNQCRELIEAGIPGIHFYVLNKSKATAKVLEAVGLREAVS